MGHTHEKSNSPVSCHAFVSTLNYVSPIGENSYKIRQLNSKNNGPVLLFKTIIVLALIMTGASESILVIRLTFSVTNKLY